MIKRGHGRAPVRYRRATAHAATADHISAKIVICGWKIRITRGADYIQVSATLKNK